ncbi:SHOCT domain-containing protein [Cryobacterium zhongshanensis]|uniref:SHOCT domain-containing protein n=1 Tax=Cryobacterium zhongshanensis TaxID=2928153 RepID=A0AA41ULE5_9MICO|nr:SHOCT domain-containing protein [Cryobacterium zhongshanensis]MCI4658821.1 SHOCT domain-containing protein [Cryobacterium zhongshanensis]
MARTAVIAGTATAVSGNVSRRQQAQAQSAAGQQAAQQQAQQAQYAPPPPPAAAEDDSLSAQIERLATLKTAGVISEAEFSAAKAKLLGI